MQLKGEQAFQASPVSDMNEFNDAFSLKTLYPWPILSSNARLVCLCVNVTPTDSSDKLKLRGVYKHRTGWKLPSSSQFSCRSH